jgi:hypothetical protein
MYTLPPLAPTVGIGGVGGLGLIHGLPATGAGRWGPLGILALILVVAGALLVSRLLLRVLVSAGIAGFALWTIATGRVTGTWDAVGLAVAVLTLAYGSVAFRNLLPAGPPVPATTGITKRRYAGNRPLPTSSRGSAVRAVAGPQH